MRHSQNSFSNSIIVFLDLCDTPIFRYKYNKYGITVYISRTRVRFGINCVHNGFHGQKPRGLSTRERVDKGLRS